MLVATSRPCFFFVPVQVTQSNGIPSHVDHGHSIDSSTVCNCHHSSRWVSQNAHYVSWKNFRGKYNFTLSWSWYALYVGTKQTCNVCMAIQNNLSKSSSVFMTSMTLSVTKRHCEYTNPESSKKLFSKMFTLHLFGDKLYFETLYRATAEWHFTGSSAWLLNYSHKVLKLTL